MLGTFVEITAPPGHGAAVDAAFAAMAHVHARMSFHDPVSDLARLRAAAPGEVVAVDPETIEVLRIALSLHQASGGLFDVTIGRQLVRSGFLPRDGIGHLAGFTGTSADICILAGNRVRLDRRVLIDLGGIAKGHAVDRAVEALLAAGVPAGLVNAGGDLRAFGDRDWPVHLRDADDVVRHMVLARTCAIASSANLLNRRMFAGSSHSPHIGAARRSVVASERVTVIAGLCVIADAMTKVAMADAGLAQRLLAGYGGRLLHPVPVSEFA